MRKYPPYLDAYHFLRLVLSLLLGFWVARSPGWSNYRPLTGPDLQVTLRAGQGGGFLALVLLILFLAAPEWHTYFAREDRLVEWTSFSILVLAAGLIIYAALNFEAPTAKIKPAKAFLFFLGAITLLVALEEVSWFQRVLDIETPDSFASNQQFETNLHNFLTTETELLYYMSAAVFFLLTPFLVACAPALENGVAERILPDRSVAFGVIVMNTICEEMWNIILIQVASWTSLFILVFVAMKDARLKSTAMYLLSVLVLSQVI